MVPKIKRMSLMKAEFVEYIDDEMVGDMALYRVTSPIEDSVPFGLQLGDNGLHQWHGHPRHDFGISIDVFIGDASVADVEAFIANDSAPRELSLNISFSY